MNNFFFKYRFKSVTNIFSFTFSSKRKFGVALSVFLFFALQISAQSDFPKIDSLKALYQKTNIDTVKLDVLYRLSSIYYPRYDSCIHYSNELVKGAKALNHKRYHALGMARTATLMASKGNYDEALEYANKSLQVFENEKNKEIYCVLHESIGYINYLKQDYYQSVNDYLKAISFMDSTSEDPEVKMKLAKLYIDLATALSKSSKFDKAVEYYLEALQLNDSQLLSKSIVGRLYNNIGNQYQMLYKNDKAVEYLQQAYQIKTELNDIPGRIVALRNLSIIALRNHDFEQGEQKILKALDLAYQSPRAARYIPLLNRSAGSVYKTSKQYAKAETYYRRALEGAMKQNQPKDLASAYLSLGSINILLNNFQEAKKNIDLGLSISNINDDKVFLANAYQAMSSLDSAMGNYASSLANYKKYKSLKDSLLSLEKNKVISELEIAYETQSKDNEISLLKKDRQLEKVQADRQSIILKGFILISILLLIIVFVFYRQNKHKQHSVNIIKSQKEELETKNNENETLIKEIHHRVRNNLQIMLSLLNAQSFMLEDDDRAKKIIQESQNRIKSMALIHKNLYKSGNYIMVESQGYFEDLIANLRTSFEEKDQKVEIKKKIANIEIKMTLAVPLGLILNELVSNAYKYAFENDRHGELEVIFEKSSDDNGFLLKVHDNGVGLIPNFEMNQPQAFGLKMVHGLAEQLDGDVKINVESGAKFDVTIKDQQE